MTKFEGKNNLVGLTVGQKDYIKEYSQVFTCTQCLLAYSTIASGTNTGVHTKEEAEHNVKLTN